MKPINALPNGPVTRSKSSGLSRPYKPNVPLNYQRRQQAEPEEVTVAAAAEMTPTQTGMDRTTTLQPPRHPPPPPPTEINIEEEDENQNQPLLSTNINTSELIPPSPARSTLYNSTNTAQSQPTMVQQIPPAPIVYQPPAALPVPAPAPFPTPRANITLQHYDGKSSAVQFWKQFMTFMTLMNVPMQQVTQYFSFYLKDTAWDWFFTLTPEVTSSLETLKTAFLDRFRSQIPLSLGLVDITQQNAESADQYISRIQKLATDSTMPEDCLTAMIIKGLQAPIRKIVMPQFPRTIDSLRTAASIAEMTIKMDAQTMTNEEQSCVVNAMSAVCGVTNQLQQAIAAMTTNQENNSNRSTVYQRDHPNQDYNNQRPPHRESRRNQWQPQQYQKQYPRQQQYSETQGPPQQSSRLCTNCGGESCFSKSNCPARGSYCRKCQKYNHFEDICINHFLKNRGKFQ